jgi:alcohol dehydrogenase
VTITTGLVDTYSTPTLVQLLQGHQIDAAGFVIHHFQVDESLGAYDVFAHPGEAGSSKSCWRAA